MDDVGFHPNYGSEYWSVEDSSVAFERDLEPGEAYTTIYGLRDYPEDEMDALFEEPVIDLVDTDHERLEDVIDENRSQVVREFLSGEADLPGLDAEIQVDAADRTGPPAEPIETGGEEAVPAEPEPESVGVEVTATAASETEQPSQPDIEPEPEPGEDATSPSASREVRVPLTGGVVRVLIKELREGDVDPEDRRMLRDELLDTEGSTESRISHLQQRVSDLEAYSDALEAFIDDEGTAQAIISDLRDEVTGLERTVRTTDDRLDEVLELLDALEDRLDTVDGEVASVVAREEALADRLEDLEDDVHGMDEHLDEVGSQIDQVSVDIDAIDDQTDDLVGRLDDLGGELGEIRRDLRDDLEEIQSDIEAFESFRAQLSTVFGRSEQPLDDELTEE